MMFMRLALNRIPRLVVILCLTWGICLPEARGDTGNESYVDPFTSLAVVQDSEDSTDPLAALSDLADQCDSLERADLAKATRDWLPTAAPSRLRLYLPPSRYSDLVTVDPDDSTARFWAQRVQRIRKQHAILLLQQARERMAEPTRANQLAATRELYQAAMQDPEHPEINAILGRRKRGDEFPFVEYQRFTAKPARRPDPVLQWEAGSYLEVQSANFKLVTTVDADTARGMLARMETWRLLWRQWAIAYWMTPEAFQYCLQQGRPFPSTGERRHEMVLFANRQQFLDSLRQIAGIERSVGYYDGQLHRSFFYLPTEPGDLETTWQHELTHQLFSETGRRVEQPGETSNTWLAEGIAIYTESLKPCPDQKTPDWNAMLGRDAVAAPPANWSLGGFEARRLQDARLRWFREGYFVPFSQLTARGRMDFQADRQIFRTYSQAGAMCQFLLHFDQGRYEPAVWELLERLYAGRDRADSLTTASGTDTKTLEEQYRQWLPFDPDLTRQFRFAGNSTDLALGYSDLESVGLAQLRPSRLIQLQLSATSVDDRIASWLSSFHTLQQVFLDKTAIGTPAVQALAQHHPALQSLDLAGTRITNDAIQDLAQLAELKRLWLTSTTIDDDAIADLLKFPKLEYLHIQGTRISSQGCERLRQKIAEVVN